MKKYYILEINDAIGKKDRIIPACLNGYAPIPNDFEYKVFTGSFCMVYPLARPGKTPDKCIRLFHKSFNKTYVQQVANEITRLKQDGCSFLMQYEYFERGLRLDDGEVIPAVVMDWIEGDTLISYINKSYNQSKKIASIADEFVRMVSEMQQKQIAHGDLSGTNILVTRSGNLKLIDYDSFYSPNISPGVTICTNGTPGYQHPDRKKQKVPIFSANMDNFSQQVIFLSMKAVVRQPSLGMQNKGFIDDTKMFFVADDFKSINKFLQSDGYKAIAAIGSTETKSLLRELTRARESEISKVKSIVEIVSDSSNPRTRSSSSATKREQDITYRPVFKQTQPTSTYMPHCIYCGYLNNHDGQYCTHCGRLRMKYSNTQKNFTTMKICPKCDREYPDDAIHCGECGTKLISYGSSDDGSTGSSGSTTGTSFGFKSGPILYSSLLAALVGIVSFFVFRDNGNSHSSDPGGNGVIVVPHDTTENSYSGTVTIVNNSDTVSAPVQGNTVVEVVNHNSNVSVTTKTKANQTTKHTSASNDNSNSTLNGYHDYTFANGDRYVGYWVDNQMHGEGTYYFADGDRYEGNYENDLFNGYGTYYYANGDRYEGNWKNNRRNGYGSYYFANGDRYEGNWMNSKRHGQGTMYWTNGCRYEGNWENDKMHGDGVQYNSDGSTIEGTWENGELKEYYVKRIVRTRTYYPK